MMPQETPDIYFSLEELEKFIDDAVDQYHTRPDNDPLTVDMMIRALRKFIDSKTQKTSN